MSTMMNANGNAVTVMKFCRPCSACWPPATRITTAMPAIHATQKMVTHFLGCGLPRCESWEFTRDAESAVVMKKTASMTTTTGAMNCAPGRWSSTIKKISGAAGMESAVPSGAMVPCVRCIHTVVPPRMVNAATMINDGINSTPKTY